MAAVKTMAGSKAIASCDIKVRLGASVLIVPFTPATNPRTTLLLNDVEIFSAYAGNGT